MSTDNLIGLFGLLFIAAIIVRVTIVYRQTGNLPVVFGATDSAHDFIHRILVAAICLEAVNILAHRFQAFSAWWSTSPELTIFAFTGPLQSLETPTIKAAGLLIAYAGLAWSVTAQHQMGADWRVGIDTKTRTSLVTLGLYKISRHPIYLGFMVIGVGLFLAVPTMVSLIAATMFIVALPIQARLEEEYLLTCHGNAYRHYLANSRRWI
ncbi:MAG: isoprenylcysteine carboxylmethyltransferase family protein [Alphaproteobacteria bacterium]|nr:isoprenylcysteine carboxylmethyltransferase family protein [Alphaproteobacteria bacterium]